MFNALNPRTTVLVTSGDADVAATTEKITDLATGQIGVFNAATNLGLDGTSPTREIYIATATGTTETYRKSNTIPVSGITSYNLRCYTPNRAWIKDITMSCANCDDTFTVKFDITDGEAFYNYGFQQFSKSFVVTSDCCEGCDCGELNCKEVAKNLRAQINADPDGLFTCTLLDPSTLPAVPGTDLSDSEVDALGAAVCPTIRITGNANTLATYCGVNHKYAYPLMNAVTISLLDGMTCCATQADIQTVVFAEGEGEQIKNEEYKFKAHMQGGPIRLTQSGVDLFSGFSVADASETYHVISIGYTEDTQNGFIEYNNEKMVHIAVPCDDTTTSAALVGVLDGLFADANISNQFGPLANDLAACEDCGDVDTTSTKSAGEEGIG
jgi:hypothetical protein